MYVEYLGIPGCGKTYTKLKYMDDLHKKNICCVDLSRQRDMKLWLCLFYKLAEFVILIIPKYKQQFKEYLSVCSNRLQYSKYLPFSIDYCIKDIVLASFLHDVFSSKKTIYLNDEGQLQRIAFLVVQYQVSLEKLIEIYQKNKKDTRTIYVNTDKNNAFSNIKKRNRHVCPMDELSDERLESFLADFYLCCENIKLILNEYVDIKG